MTQQEIPENIVAIMERIGKAVEGESQQDVFSAVAVFSGSVSLTEEGIDVMAMRSGAIGAAVAAAVQDGMEVPRVMQSVFLALQDMGAIAGFEQVAGEDDECPCPDCAAAREKQRYAIN